MSETVYRGIPNQYHTLAFVPLKKEGDSYSWNEKVKFTKKTEKDFVEFRDCLFVGGSIILKEYFEKAEKIFELMERNYEIWVTEKKDFPIALISNDKIDNKVDGLLIAPRIDEDLRNELISILNFKEKTNGGKI